jgi:hypothetical protein
LMPYSVYLLINAFYSIVNISLFLDTRHLCTESFYYLLHYCIKRIPKSRVIEPILPSDWGEWVQTLQSR